MFKEWFLKRFGKKEIDQLFEEAYEEALDETIREMFGDEDNIPNFIKIFCIPKNIQEFNYESSKLEEIYAKLWDSLWMIDDHYKNEREKIEKYFSVKHVHNCAFVKFFDIQIEIAGCNKVFQKISFKFKGEPVGALKRDASGHMKFVSNYPEVKNSIIFTCQHLIHEGKIVREKKVQQLLNDMEKMTC